MQNSNSNAGTAADSKLKMKKQHQAKLLPSPLLSAALLSEYGFKLVEVGDSPFDDYKMPYFCKDAVILFFNRGEWNENSFYIGYAEGRFGKYTVVPFRWISIEKELIEIYKAVRGIELSKGSS
jgi:hypothetical protein